MARKYSRDNRGRFASSGSGATARGGRLRTASGNKRKTQTMKAAGAGGAGVMKGKVARDPGAAGKIGKAPPVKATRQPSGAAKPTATGLKRKVDVQIQRASAGGQYGPDGHWYAGGAWMSQGKFVGGKPAQAVGAGAQSAANQKGKGNGASVSVIRNKAPEPKPLTPTGKSLPSEPGINKTAKKLNQEFFGDSGFLNRDMEKQFRAAGGRGRDPISNTRYLGALATRASSKDLRARTLGAVKGLSKENRKSYIRDVQDARRNMEMTKFGVPRVGASDKQLMNAIRFDVAARNLAGQRSMRKRAGGRNSSEEYAWVTNAMLMTSRKRK